MGRTGFRGRLTSFAAKKADEGRVVLTEDGELVRGHLHVRKDGVVIFKKEKS